MGWKPYGRAAFGIVGMAKQVNRRVADSGHDVQESFTVEHRLHVSAFAVCRMAQAFLSVWTSCKTRQNSQRVWFVGIMFNAARYVLRLVTESAYICLDLGISLFVSAMRWRFAHAVQKAWAACPHGKSPWADDGMSRNR